MSSLTYHGGDLATAARHYGGDPAAWLDLSTGINPRPWPGAAHLPCDWHPLPDPMALTALEAVAARHFGVAPDLCCAVPGSEMALRLIGRWLSLPAAFLFPAYRTHGTAFADAAALRWPDDPLPPDRQALLLANPNNPDGRIIPQARLQAWHDHLARRDGWLIVDEAFADATPALSLARHVGAWDRLIVLRSFGKFFGLAGLRLGFVLGPPAVMAMLRSLLGDWPLGAAALVLGRAAYADAAWIAQTRHDLAHRAARMDALLARHGLTAIGACPQFRLIADDRAPALFDCLARQAILTRPFDYDPRWLRLGVPATEDDRDRLAQALAHG